MSVNNLAARSHRDGVLWPSDIITAEGATLHRARLTAAEAVVGSLHYAAKVHTLLTSPWELATSPRVLNLVAQLLGDNILLYNCTYIIKEPHSTGHVSWHQDLTYWGFDSDAQVSMWLALSPATRTSGCMQVIPGSHTRGQLPHQPTRDATNLLYNGQTVCTTDSRQAVACELRPGQASFHHGWTLHASAPNRSAERRIGLNV